MEEFYARGWGKLYGGPVNTAAGWGYILLCICFLDYLHDTWFYWTHRLLHWRPLYRWVHWEHHRCATLMIFVLLFWGGAWLQALLQQPSGTATLLATACASG